VEKQTWGRLFVGSTVNIASVHNWPDVFVQRIISGHWSLIRRRDPTDVIDARHRGERQFFRRWSVILLVAQTQQILQQPLTTMQNTKGHTSSEATCLASYNLFSKLKHIRLRLGLLSLHNFLHPTQANVWHLVLVVATIQSNQKPLLAPILHNGCTLSWSQNGTWPLSQRFCYAKLQFPRDVPLSPNRIVSQNPNNFGEPCGSKIWTSVCHPRPHRNKRTRRRNIRHVFGNSRNHNIWHHIRRRGKISNRDDNFGFRKQPLLDSLLVASALGMLLEIAYLGSLHCGHSKHRKGPVNGAGVPRLLAAEARNTTKAPIATMTQRLDTDPRLQHIPMLNQERIGACWLEIHA
jgi:hypothetical protein